jgi:opacity protein-like surface antigen
MRKLLFVGLMISLCLCIIAVPGYSASVGGAETQGRNKIGVSVDQEFIFDRDMKYVSGTEGIDWGKVEIDSMYRTMGKISYGLLDNLDLYVKLGTADAKIKGPATYNDPSTGPQSGTYVATTSNAFAWGLGAKGTYEFAEDWLLGADVQYLRHRHSADFSYGEESWDGKVLFQEWQVAPYLAKRIGNFTPYAGVKYSDLRMNHKDDYGTVKFKADDNFGMFVGTGYKLNDRLSLNVEGRFIDETAMSVACTYKF